MILEDNVLTVSHLCHHIFIV